MTALVSIYQTMRGLADVAERNDWENASRILGAADYVWEQMTPAERASTPDPSWRGIDPAIAVQLLRNAANDIEANAPRMQG